MKYALLLLALCVAGCVQAPPPQPLVKVMTKFGPSSCGVHQVLSSTGEYLGSMGGSGYNLQISYLTVPEFTFRYEHDQAFRESVASYEFR